VVYIGECAYPQCITQILQWTREEWYEIILVPTRHVANKWYVREELVLTLKVKINASSRVCRKTDRSHQGYTDPPSSNITSLRCLNSVLLEVVITKYGIDKDAWHFRRIGPEEFFI
jgi:hypothetical protein